jgi:hypothetical protein
MSLFSEAQAKRLSSHPDQMLSFCEWCALNGFSERTGRRILASGKGPVVTWLSPKQMRVSIRNNARWQRSREKRA